MSNNSYAYWNKKSAIEDYSTYIADLQTKAREQKEAEEFFKSKKFGFNFSFSFEVLAIGEKCTLMQSAECGSFYIAKHGNAIRDIMQYQELQLIGDDFKEAIKVFYLINKKMSPKEELKNSIENF